jgi:hypothetical protein
MKENIHGIEPIIHILYHSFEILELKLVKVEHFDVETATLKPKYLLEFKQIKQIAYFKDTDVYDTIGSTLFAYRNSVTGYRSLLSCYLPISLPLSKADLTQMSTRREGGIEPDLKSYAHLLRMIKFNFKNSKKPSYKLKGMEDRKKQILIP